MQTVSFPWQPATVKTIIPLWYYHGSQWDILKCAISWKRLTIKRIRSNFGSRRPKNRVCSVLWICDSLSLHNSMHCRFPILRFSEGYFSHSFHPISSKCYRKYGNNGIIQAMAFMTITQTLEMHDILAISNLSYIEFRHKAVLVPCAFPFAKLFFILNIEI